MSRYHSYINSAKEILDVYSGKEPFSIFLKKFFAANKKFGSKDRKQISHLCYCYFRLGKTAEDLIPEKRILAGLFLCSNSFNEILEALQPEWNKKINATLDEKFLILQESLEIQSSAGDVFPWKDELSDGIESEKFSSSFFTQPDLFIRIRPGYAEEVFQKLNEAGVEYGFIPPFTIRVPNSSRIDKYFEPDKQTVIQDLNSQKVSEYISLAIDKKTATVWDCCAASGGKSIMAYDLNPDIVLTVTDIRENILINLGKRFQHAGISKYKGIVMDLTNNQQPRPTGSSGRAITSNYDLIIADVPCTGSGTWSRTPEQLFYFDSNKIDEYAKLQKKIIRNVISSIKPGGYFLYITCSVFKKENEENVYFIKENFDVDLIRMEILKGYDKKADSLFAALFKQPL